MSKVLVLGDGLLGKEIVKQTKWDYISRKKDGFDITKNLFFLQIVSDFEKYDTILNCIAHTDTYSQEKEKHWEVNYKAVSDLVSYCNENNKKLIHISTDYIYANSNLDADEDATVPVHANNWYSYTKLLGDAHIQLMSKDYLIIRCSHKPKPFPYDKAWYNQWGNFDYVDVIANLIVRLVLSNAKGIYNVGTKCKRMFSLARETKPGIESITAPTNVPYDVSMNITKMKTKLGDNL